MSAAELPAHLPPHESRQGVYDAVSFLVNILSPIFVILRMTCRIKSQNKVWLDDYLIIAAQILLFGTFANTCYELGNFVGHHIEYTPQERLPAFFKGYIFCEAVYGPIIGLIKLSTLAFYWRIFSLTSRIPILITAGVVTAWMVTLFFFTMFQCSPVQAAWQPWIVDKKCFDLKMLLLGGAIPNIITDAVVVVMPIPYVLRLQMRTTQRIAVIGVFLLGFFVTAVSIIRIVLSMQQDVRDPDFTWNMTYVTIWTTVEMNVAVICACLPMLKPILNFLRTGRMFPTKESSESESGSDQPSDNSGKRFKGFFGRKASDTENVAMTADEESLGSSRRIINTVKSRSDEKYGRLDGESKDVVNEI